MVFVVVVLAFAERQRVRAQQLLQLHSAPLRALNHKQRLGARSNIRFTVNTSLNVAQTRVHSQQRSATKSWCMRVGQVHHFVCDVRLQSSRTCNSSAHQATARVTNSHVVSELGLDLVDRFPRCCFWHSGANVFADQLSNLGSDDSLAALLLALKKTAQLALKLRL